MGPFLFFPTIIALFEHGMALFHRASYVKLSPLTRHHFYMGHTAYFNFQLRLCQVPYNLCFQQETKLGKLLSVQISKLIQRWCEF